MFEVSTLSEKVTDFSGSRMGVLAVNVCIK